MNAALFKKYCARFHIHLFNAFGRKIPVNTNKIKERKKLHYFVYASNGVLPKSRRMDPL